jgi:hypothetical protein
MEKQRTSGEVLAEIVNNGSFEECCRESHERWRTTKLQQGWTYGPEKDSVRKTNPLMVPYEELPQKERGLNRVTPYSVVNFLRVEYKDKNPSELEKELKELREGRNAKELQRLSEYVHSHFIAAQLARGETVNTRNDLVVYECLTPEVQSWDTEMAKEIMGFVLRGIKK